MKRLTILLAVLLVALVGCDTPPPLPAPAPAAEPTSVTFFGDSLTPVVDYAADGDALGYDVTTSGARGGSDLCTVVHGYGMWQHVAWALQTHDVVVLQYQGWGNYSKPCGPTGHLPATNHESPDPGKKWRIHLEVIALGARQHGTRVYLAESPGARPDKVSWITPQNIMDTAARTMADRYPDVLTFVPSRRYFTDAEGAWVERSGCLAEETALGFCEGGSVRLRGDDGVHYACPGTTGLTCAGRTPAGVRHSRVMYAAIGGTS